QAELRALAIDPDNGWSALSLLISHLNATGDVGAARRALDGFPEATKSLTLVSRRSPTGIGDVAFMIGMWVYLDVMERRFTEAFSGPNFQIGLAQIEARVGAPEEAIKRLRRLLSIPAGWEVSIARLKIDPVWDPIRNRPDFQKLLSGPEQIGPNK